jgi:2-succinyl-5-enolpyruvyl-6-hydroxy-3-cyclohexene-1-carboxylate synthase
MYRLKYHKVSNVDGLQQILPSFFANNSQAQLLEIDTQSVDNAQVLKDYFKALK